MRASRCLLALCVCAGAFAGDAPAPLRERYQALRDDLAHSAFGYPLHLDSRETAGESRGDAHAVVEHPFDLLRTELQRPEAWCDILMVVFNVKHCETGDGHAARKLVVNIGRKHDTPLADTYRVELRFAVTSATAEHLLVELAAEQGPLGTRDFRIALAAIPLHDGRSFMHLKFAYTSGMAARVATRAYLATVGRDKIGFTMAGRQADGSPIHVGGVPGMIERNTMRYYLAIDAYLDSLAAPPAQQLDKRLTGWFDATARYARQLHEMERAEYLVMKRKEAHRQGEPSQPPR